MRQILNGSKHLLDLVNELLDTASIEAGRLSLSPEVVAVEEVVQQVLELLQPLAAARRIALTCDARSNTTLHVRADRQRLKQVVVNLVGNAIKYNRDEGTVTVSWAPEADGFIRTSVADSGPRISPDQMALLFQPFERLGAERSSTEGTGLGLAVSKGLAEAMGGRLDIASTLDVGTTFWIDLPRADTSAWDSGRPATSAGASDLHHASGTLLYIEDNAPNIRLMQRLLSRRAGIRLLSAMTGEDGVAMARSDRPDLILLDLHLPDMTGEAVLARLCAAEDTSRILVAVLSADAVTDRSDRLLAAGAVAYLTKPLDMAKVLRLIDMCLIPGRTAM